MQMCAMDTLFSEGLTYGISADERAIRLQIISDEFVFWSTLRLLPLTGMVGLLPTQRHTKDPGDR